MKTLLTDNPIAAAALLRGGGLVAFPTETVYGLGADAFNAQAVAAIFGAKVRPADNPLIVHLAHQRQIAEVARAVSPEAAHLIRKFFPGPLTVVLRRHPSLPPAVTAHLDTVAVRMPAHALAQRFLDACKCPVAAPSANRSGRPSATTWEAVHEDLNGRIAAILRGAPSAQGIESTVVDCSDGSPRLLRPGAVSVEQLLTVVPALRRETPDMDHAAASPGMRHRHYAPRARIALISTPSDAIPHRAHAYIGMDPMMSPGAFGRSLHVENEQEYARALFDFFRLCESSDIRTIYCQTTSDVGIGRALMDRLRRAAGS